MKCLCRLNDFTGVEHTMYNCQYMLTHLYYSRSCDSRKLYGVIWYGCFWNHEECYCAEASASGRGASVTRHGTLQTPEAGAYTNA